MENVIKRTSTAKQQAALPEFLILSRQSGALTALFRKIRELLSSVRDFIECPVFYVGETTNTSGFENKILQINKLNNK